jgi:hypothetical protein
VDPVTENALRAAEEAVQSLVAQCRRGGRLYNRNPRAVAQVSRTAKWHLAAIDALRKALDAANNSQGGEDDHKRGA